VKYTDRETEIAQRETEAERLAARRRRAENRVRVERVNAMRLWALKRPRYPS